MYLHCNKLNLHWPHTQTQTGEILWSSTSTLHRMCELRLSMSISLYFLVHTCSPFHFLSHSLSLSFLVSLTLSLSPLPFPSPFPGFPFSLSLSRPPSPYRFSSLILALCSISPGTPCFPFFCRPAHPPSPSLPHRSRQKYSMMTINSQLVFTISTRAVYMRYVV